MVFFKYNIIIITFIFLFSINSNAATTSFFSTANLNFYEDAQTDGTMISENNVLTLAPKPTLIEGIVEPFVWKIYAKNKDEIYVATGGNNGKLYKLDTDKNRFIPFVEVAEKNLTSVIVSPDGMIYAASSPNSKLYVYNDSGELQNEIILDDMYVWDMEFDASGNLYLATGGTQGRVLVLESGMTLKNIDSFQEISLLNEKHSIDLAYDENNDNMYVGTSGVGLLIKLNKDYSYDVVYDSEEKEVHSIVIDSKGNVFFGTADREKNNILTELSSGQAQPNSMEARLFKNSLYKASPKGAVQRVFNLNQTLIFGLVKDNMDNVYFATGDEGKLYQINANGTLNYVMDFGGQNITSISPTENFIYLTTKTGEVYELTKGYDSYGTLTSGVLDTGYLSRFGVVDYYVSLPEGSSFKIETRSGNTKQVDSTWSEFEVVVENNKIQSPNARFLQFRVTLSTEDMNQTPILTSLSLSYLPENLRPEIYRPMFVTFNDQKNLQIDAYKKPALKEGQVMLIWNGNDPNKDNLSYSVYYKLAGDTNYSLLVRDSINAYYIFDANRLASGIYDFKIVASDHLNNGTLETMTNYIELLNVKHDKDAPTISDVKFSTNSDGKKMLQFTITDQYSVLSSVRLASFNGRWRYLSPRDGLLDGKEETFFLVIDSPSITSVTIEATDAEGNVGYYSYLVQ